MPPTTEEFEKLLALRGCLQGLAAQDASAGDALLALLPGLRRVFGPAFPAAAHHELDDLEAALREGRLRPEAVRASAARLSRALGLPFLDPEEAR